MDCYLAVFYDNGATIYNLPSGTTEHIITYNPAHRGKCKIDFCILHSGDWIFVQDSSGVRCVQMMHLVHFDSQPCLAYTVPEISLVDDGETLLNPIASRANAVLCITPIGNFVRRAYTYGGNKEGFIAISV